MSKSIFIKFNESLPAIIASIKKDTEKQMEDMNRRGILLSGIAIETFIDTGMKSLMNGMIELLKKIATLKPSITEWEEIRSSLKQFSNERRQALYNECCHRWEPRLHPREVIKNKLTDLEKSVLNEADIFIDSYIQSIKEERSNKFNAIIWDIIKVIIGGIIGYILAKAQ